MRISNLFGYGIDDITSMITWLETLGDKDENEYHKKPSYRSVDEVAENIKPKTGEVTSAQ